jgi:hypothetical protein
MHRNRNQSLRYHPVSIPAWLVIVLSVIYAAWHQRTAAAASPAPLLAQMTSSRSAPSDGQIGDLDLWSRVAILLAVIFAVYLITYFIVFPMMLRRQNRPPWPISLYGKCNAIAWLIWVLAAFGIFFNKLQIVTGSGITPWGQYGPRAALIAVAFLGAFIWWFLFRSPEPKNERSAADNSA